MQIDLCLDIELSMGIYHSRRSLDPMIRNSILPGLGFSLDPVIQVDTPNKQCCNFSKYSLALETDRDM